MIIRKFLVVFLFIFSNNLLSQLSPPTLNAQGEQLYSTGVQIPIATSFSKDTLVL